MPMTLRMLILRKEYESSRLLSVGEGITINTQVTELTLGIELELDEEGTRISLTIVDTPGFGDQIDNEERCAVLGRRYK